MYAGHFSTLLGHWGNEDYSHCYLVPVIFLYLLWASRHALLASMGGSQLPGLLVLILGMMVFLMGRLGSMETLVYGSMWISLAGLALVLLGHKAVKNLVFPYLILIFAVPLPPFLNNQLSFKLRLWSSALAERILQALSIPVFREGNVIDLGVTQLQVVDACSGLRYLFPTMLMALLVGHFFLRRSWTKVLLFALCPLLTLISNSLRIAVTGLLVRYFNPRLAEGFFHDFSGWLVYMFTLFFLVLLTLLLRRMESQASREPSRDEPAAAVNGRPAARGIAWPAALAAGLVLVLGWWAQDHLVQNQVVPERRSFSQFPDQIAGWQGERLFLSDQILDSLWADDYVSGNFSHPRTGNTLHLLISYYQRQTTRNTAHAPTSCLLGSGWDLEHKKVLEPNPATGRDFPIQSMLLEQNGGRILSNFWFEQRGRLITSEYWNKFYLFWDGLTMGRTDGALVRVELYLQPGQSVAQGQRLLDEFVGNLRTILGEYVPR